MMNGLPGLRRRIRYSFSTDPNAKGAPTGHTLPVREVRLSNGAEFVVVICGEIMTMPGLPKVPAANSIEVNAEGSIVEEISYVPPQAGMDLMLTLDTHWTWDFWIVRDAERAALEVQDYDEAVILSAQTALPDWVRARGLSVFLTVFFGSMAAGSLVWGQVAASLSLEQLREFRLLIATPYGFQGEERDVIYISLVRSNERQEIGFLNDLRRMNVAITRARKKLVVIGDSATIGATDFYRQFLEYCEKHGLYRSAWEFAQ